LSSGPFDKSESERTALAPPPDVGHSDALVIARRARDSTTRAVASRTVVFAASAFSMSRSSVASLSTVHQLASVGDSAPSSRDAIRGCDCHVAGIAIAGGSYSGPTTQAASRHADDATARVRIMRQRAAQVSKASIPRGSCSGSLSEICSGSQMMAKFAQPGRKEVSTTGSSRTRAGTRPRDPRVDQILEVTAETPAAVTPCECRRVAERTAILSGARCLAIAPSNEPGNGVDPSS
jgi:hypothetical protein